MLTENLNTRSTFIIKKSHFETAYSMKQMIWIDTLSLKWSSLSTKKQKKRAKQLMT